MESLRTAQSILWMLDMVKTRGGFDYSEWADRFRPGEAPLEPRKDRKFHNHLKLFKEEALDLFRGSKDVQLLSAKGRYSIAMALDESAVERMSDGEGANFLPLLHGLNSRRNMLPFPAPLIERQLINALDIWEGTLGRVVYKSAFNWRFDRQIIDTFLDAIHSKTKLFVRPDKSRSPCEITPLFIVAYEGSWHLLGLDKDILQYSLSRVLELKATTTPATVVDESTLAKLRAAIEGAFGINLVTPLNALNQGTEVTIRYSGKALRYARERFDPGFRQPNDPWFKTDDQDEFVDVTMRVFAYGEAISEVLRWGASAEAIQPEDFRNLWFEEIEGMVEAFL